MSLGQNIYSLRTAREMSQLELAEALGVSRQSISKWETDASTPELEKLIKLSQLFGVTLDELVSVGRDDPGAPHESSAPDSPPVGADAHIGPQNDTPTPQYIYVTPKRQARKTVGTILLCMAFLTALLLAILGELIGGLVLALPFVVCGIICLCAKRLPGLWCAWTLYFLVTLYLQYATGVTLNFALSGYLWKYSELTVQMIIATALLAILVALMLTTAYHLRSPHINLLTNWKKPLIIALMLLALRLVLYFSSTKLNVYFLSQGMQFANALLVTLTISLRTAIFTALLTLASRCIKWKK